MKKKNLLLLTFTLVSIAGYYTYFGKLKKEKELNNNWNKYIKDYPSDSIFIQNGIENFEGKLFTDSLFFTKKDIQIISAIIDEQITLNMYQNIVFTGFYGSQEEKIKGRQRISYLLKRLSLPKKLKGVKVFKSQKVFINEPRNKKFKTPIAITLTPLNDIEIFRIKKKELYMVYFWGNKTYNHFKPNKRLTIYTQKLIKFINEHPDKKFKIKIIGHTDNIGASVDNKWVGMQRAKNIRNYFLSEGISISLMEVSSKGETKPLESNLNKYGQIKNRRVEIIID